MTFADATEYINSIGRKVIGLQDPLDRMKVYDTALKDAQENLSVTEANRAEYFFSAVIGIMRSRWSKRTMGIESLQTY